MTDDVARARRRLVVALLLLVLVAGAVAGAFYFLDGMTLIQDLLAGRIPWNEAEPAGRLPVSGETTTAVDPLAGLPDDFVRRVWAEQVDSQSNIRKLITGEITGLTVNVTAVHPDQANLNVTAEFKDGTSADGILGLRRYGDSWFLMSARGMRDPSTGGSAASVSASGTLIDVPLPPMSEVNREVIAAVVAEQRESQSTIGEYLAGRVRRIDVLSVVDGPNTKTLKVKMTEDHEIAEADIVCISVAQDDDTLWFVTSFEKTGSTPK